MEEDVEKKIKELYEKAQYHKDIANSYREKLEAFLDQPLAEPQDGLETLGDVVNDIRRLEKIREITLEEIFEKKQILGRYYREKAEEEREMANIKIYDLPHTPFTLIKYLMDGTMTFSDLVKYIKRICGDFRNKKD